MALKAAERASVVSNAQKSAGRKRRRAQKGRAGKLAPRVNMAPGPKRNRSRRNRGGKGMRTRNLPVSNNQRRFTVPIDEQVQLVNGTVAFTQFTFAANPGNATLFPFLSRVAGNYERYEFEDLCLEYKPSASVFATVGAQGFVGISATDDALQAPPSSQQIAEVFLHSPVVETAKATSLCLKKPFMESSTKQLHFVRPNGLIPGGADPHLYDSAQFFFWTSGQANTNQIGEIRVTGRCLLTNPVLETSTTPPPQFQISQFVANAAEAVTTATPYTIKFADVTAADGFKNPLAIVNTSGSFVPPVGTYEVIVLVVSSNSGNGTGFQTQIQKNGVEVVPNARSWFVLPSGAYGSWTTNVQALVSCNGTDVITVVQLNTFSTGNSTVGGSVLFEVV